jgi:hypothetical protein
MKNYKNLVLEIYPLAILVKYGSGVYRIVNNDLYGFHGTDDLTYDGEWSGNEEDAWADAYKFVQTQFLERLSE